MTESITSINSGTIQKNTSIESSDEANSANKVFNSDGLTDEGKVVDVQDPYDLTAATKVNQSLPDPEKAVDEFLASFAKKSPLYELVEHLNQSMRQLLREVQETEVEIRINKYVSQLETAIKKHEHTIEYAQKIKEAKDKAADELRNLGITQMAMGILSSDMLFGKGIESFMHSKAQYLTNEAEKMQMDHEAMNALFDGIAGFLEKEGSLANSQFSALESIYHNIASLVDGMHREQSSAYEAMARTV
ncbi:hypothetical protein [Pleionea sediminis]|uniref:hypothetical protein n=1 Tax=Pleionea sediminis TaxID=2569479 RepID=UPI00118686F6|nr:hypothetical protein [Pleionea sediminis]